MLSDQTIAIVKATAPVLDEHGETLTKHFYKRMFAHNPEVLPFFNPANQAGGSQQRALAAAICAYAANIDNLEVLGGAVELIAQKHASLLIKPEHYPIVGENLLASIREVLGAAATEDIINAWAEAYGILIGREAQIYADQVAQPNGWSDFKKFRIERKVAESEIITSFYLVPEDGSGVPHFKPGQYVTVRVPSPCGHTTMRNYSLSDKPGQEWLRISVKREVGAKADTPKGYVSNLLHDTMDVGGTVELAPPCGEFFLDETVPATKPLVLLAGGIGITPILSILKSALEKTPERQIILVHGCLNEKVQPFADKLKKLGTHENLNVHFVYSEPVPAGMTRLENAMQGMIDAVLLEKILPSRDADYYFCGPKPFMVSVYHQLLSWGIPASQAHFEFFGPRQDIERAPDIMAA
jgi:nitric oxide dioxygenase